MKNVARSVIVFLLSVLFYVAILFFKALVVDLAIENIFNIEVDTVWVFVLLLMTTTTGSGDYK